MGFIRKNGRNGPSKFRLENSCIFFIGLFQKNFCGIFIHRIHIGLVIHPRRFLFQFFIEIPFFSGSLLCPVNPVCIQKSPIFQKNIIYGKQAAGNSYILLFLFQKFLMTFHHIRHRSQRQPKMSCPELHLFRHLSACRAGRITVLIIQPAQHPVFLRFFVTIAYQLHELLIQILIF